VSQTDLSCDVLVVGAGPAGSGTAAWAARSGLDVLLVDAAVFPRDKPCGDGLTPRAIAELDHLGLADWLSEQATNRGLRASGFGQTLYLPWPGGSLPNRGGAAPRLELDARIRDVALAAGVRTLEGARAIDIRRNGARVAAVVFKNSEGTFEVACQRLVVADGAKSQLGRKLGRQWHKTTVYGVAARAYIKSDRADDQWISSHLELRGTANELLSGYGWIFPLGDGEVNIGVGTLATAKNPADVNLRQLIAHYTEGQRGEWKLQGDLRDTWSALLPMGGAVSEVAGKNWLMVGDAAGCVNPLNGEGIDYGLETGRLGAELLAKGSRVELATAWPTTLQHHYGPAFSAARRLAGLLTVPGFLPKAGPVGMRSATLMRVALRVMGNLVTPEDTDALARVWRTAGRMSVRLDHRPPFT
jgi:geranylgeranyl reductase family protein